MTQNILHHGAWDERLISTIRLPEQERLSGGFSRQSQGSQRIHYEVHPQHLHSLKRRILEKTGFLIDTHIYSGTQQFSGSLLFLKTWTEQDYTFILINLQYQVSIIQLCKYFKTADYTHFALKQSCFNKKKELWTYLSNTGAREGNNHCYNINCKLELKKFGDAVIDISSPHNCFNNACKVVICENNIRCFFSYVSSSDALLKKILWIRLNV